MKPLSEALNAYVAALMAWNRVHRLVGREESVHGLISDSVEALGSLVGAKPGACWVDVGCGGGIVGVPILEIDPSARVVFVDPDSKKTAFVLDYLSRLKSAKGRFLVLSSRLEDVSRENMAEFLAQKPLLISRAFSGPSTLSDAISNSIFRQSEIFVFSKSGGLAQFNIADKT